MEVKKKKGKKEGGKNKRAREGTRSLEWGVIKTISLQKMTPAQSSRPEPRTSKAEGALGHSGGRPTIRCVFVPPKRLTISHEYKNHQPFELVCTSWVVSLNISSNMPIMLYINRLKIHGNPKGAGSRKLCKALRKVANFLMS